MVRVLIISALTLILLVEVSIAQNSLDKSDEPDFLQSQLVGITSADSFIQNRRFRNPWRIHRQVSTYLLAGSYLATVIGAAAMEDEMIGTTIIPVVGPFVTMARIDDDPFAFYQPGGRSLLKASGITQSVFLAYFVVSIIGETTYRSRQRASGVSVAPMAQGVGMSMNVRF